MAFGTFHGNTLLAKSKNVYDQVPGNVYWRSLSEKKTPFHFSCNFRRVLNQSIENRNASFRAAQTGSPVSPASPVTHTAKTKTQPEQQIHQHVHQRTELDSTWIHMGREPRRRKLNTHRPPTVARRLPNVETPTAMSFSKSSQIDSSPVTAAKKIPRWL